MWSKGVALMLYLTSRELFAEDVEIGLATGSMPPTFFRPRLDPLTVLSLEPSTVLRVESMYLLLAERSASWCLLTPLEAEIARAADVASVTALQARYPQIERSSLVEFCIRLYQRGLLRLNGVPGLAPTLLDEGPLFQDMNLVEILVTQKCNLGCPYCLAETGPNMPHLKPHLAFSAIDAAFRLPAAQPLAIQLSGGEPFLSFPLVQDLVSYIEAKETEYSRSVRVYIQTNGTLINDAIAEFIREHDILVGISCDGPSTFSDISRPMLSGRSSNSDTLRGMAILRKHDVSFGVILVLNRANVEHPNEIIDFFCELGVESLKINPINMIGHATRTWNRMAITSDEYFTFLDRFIERLIERQVQLSEGNLAEYLRYLVHRTHHYRCMRSTCGAGTSFFLVDAGGDVYPCAHSAGLPSWRLGTITEAAGDLIGLGAQNGVVKELPLRLVERIADTRLCPWRHFCEGGCAVNAYQRYGTIQAPDSLCAFYERMYPRLLERLAAAPRDFQELMDITLGRNRATVVEFCLDTNGAELTSDVIVSERSSMHGL